MYTARPRPASFPKSQRDFGAYPSTSWPPLPVAFMFLYLEEGPRRGGTGRSVLARARAPSDHESATRPACRPVSSRLIAIARSRV